MAWHLEESPLDFPHYARYDDAIRSAIPTRHPPSTPLTRGDLDERR